MSQLWTVSGENVWKRYCRSLRKSVRYALSDSLRAFVGLAPDTIELRDDEFWSLRNVSFRLAPGEGLALVGTNGAGKSTLLKILSGVIAPDRGELRVRGRMVSLMFAGAGFHPMLTGRENIYIFGAILGLGRREIERRMPAILDFAELTEFLDTPVKYYSTGMYMRLAFSVAAHSDPSVLIVDEVLAVGDIAFREKCIEHLVDMKRRGCTLLLVSHSSGYLRRLADQGLWLHRGECVSYGPIEAVLDGYLAEMESAPPGPAASTPSPGPVAQPPQVELQARGVPTIEFVEAGDAATRTLIAHQDNRLVFRVRFPGPCPEPTATLAVVTREGTTVAGASIVLAAATYPQPRRGAVFLLTFDVRPHLASLDGELVFTVSGGEGPAVTNQWPCRIVGVGGRGDFRDLQEQFTAAPGQGARDWSPAIVVDAGQQVATAASVAGQPTAWLLFDDRQELLVRAPLPAVDAPVVAVSGRFRANLAPGCYRQALEVANGTILGPELQVAEFTEPVGHVDLEGRCHIASVRVDEHGGGEGMRLGEFLLDGGTQALDELLSRKTRVATDLRNPGSGLTALATGEPCRARVRVHCRATLRDWDVSVGFRHPERGRCAAMRLRRDTIRSDSGAVEFCFEFKAHLAPGEYLLSCSVSARNERGELVEAQALDFVKCFVLGPGDNGSDGSIDFHDLQESALDPRTDAPALVAEAAHLDGSGLRLLAFSLNDETDDGRATMVAGQASTVQVDVLAASEVSTPSFKIAFVNHGKRCVSRVTGLELRHPFQPLAAGTTRRFLMRFTPHMAGGLYQVQVALLRKSGYQWTVTDRWERAAMCTVPARPRSIGPGWLEARVFVDVE